MVNINSVFESDYLKAADLEDKPHLATITKVDLETMRDNSEKLLVSFEEWEKGLLLNVTNANNIAAFCGPETDNWIGKQIVLFPTWVDFQGRSVEAIRVRAPKPKEGKTIVRSPGWKSPAASNGPPKGHPAALEDLDDEVPF